jgi:hypothetical protein
MLLAEKPIGVVAVGQFRNGGQELVIEQIQPRCSALGWSRLAAMPGFQEQLCCQRMTASRRTNLV